MSKKLTLEDLDQSGAVMFLGGRIVGKQMFLRIMAEMRQYKTIEKELGIDLITLFKALNSCWFRKFTTNIVLGDIRPKLVFQGGWYLQPNLTELPMIYALKDYGKTWALTKEELL